MTLARYRSKMTMLDGDGRDWSPAVRFQNVNAMIFATQISDVPKNTPTNNGWLKNYYSLHQASKEFFEDGALVVGFAGDGLAVGFFRTCIKWFENDGFYITQSETELPPGVELIFS